MRDASDPSWAATDGNPDGTGGEAQPPSSVTASAINELLFAILGEVSAGCAILHSQTQALEALATQSHAIPSLAAPPQWPSFELSVPLASVGSRPNALSGKAFCEALLEACMDRSPPREEMEQIISPPVRRPSGRSELSMAA